MSKCTVAVTVDGWQAMGDVAPTFRVGDAITGTVHLWVNAAVRCDGLDVKLVPIRLGPAAPGYYLGLELGGERLFEGRLEPGEYDYRFSLPSSWLPSHEGRHVAWKWVARASADIPWAIDPEGESEFRVEFAETPAGVDIAPVAESLEASPQTSGSKLQLPLTLLLLLSLLMVAAGGLGALFDIGDEEISGGIGGGGVALCILSLAAIGATSGASKQRGEMTASSLERITLTQRRGGGDYRSGAGDTIDCDVQTRGEVVSLSARLVVQEYVEWTTTKSEHTTTHRHEHVLHQQKVQLARDGATPSWRGSLGVPDPSGVPCFSVGNPPGHGVVWQVELSALSRGEDTPELTRRLLHVRPRLG